MTLLLEARWGRWCLAVVSWSWREAILMSFQTSSMVFVVLPPRPVNGEADDDEDVDEIDFEELEQNDDDEPLWRLMVLFKLLPSSHPVDGTMYARRDGFRPVLEHITELGGTETADTACVNGHVSYMRVLCRACQSLGAPTPTASLSQDLIQE
jgi:hypothetical protein